MALSEFELIEQIFARPLQRAGADSGVSLGIGDDGAVLRPTPGCELVVAVDTLVESVHFPVDFPAADLGYRAVAVNLSDLAAMAADPRWFTLSLTVPRAEESWLREFSAAMLALAAEHALQLVGGDTTRGPLTVSIQVIGEVSAGQALRRSGASPGDLIYVSGVPGAAALGLQQWQHGAREGDAISRFVRPEPRLALGRALRGCASAAIDISDGLLADLGHLTAASGVGARIDASRLPRCPCAEVSAAQWQRLALCGGDDYELCFTVSTRQRRSLERAAERTGTQLTEIGCIVTGDSVELDALQVPRDALQHGGYRHF